MGALRVFGGLEPEPESSRPPEPAVKIKALRVIHVEEIDDGPLTYIVRSIDRPDLCRFCPRDRCNATGGVCVVEVRGDVPDELCARYVVGE